MRIHTYIHMPLQKAVATAISQTAATIAAPGAATLTTMLRTTTTKTVTNSVTKAATCKIISDIGSRCYHCHYHDKAVVVPFETPDSCPKRSWKSFSAVVLLCCRRGLFPQPHVPGSRDLGWASASGFRV